MTPRAVGISKSVHKWSSLVCTLFLFMLCLTGLPLIFHDEIDQALGVDDRLFIERGDAIGQAIHECV